MTDDNVIPLKRKKSLSTGGFFPARSDGGELEPQVPNYQCECGSQWFDAVVTFNTDLTRVTGYSLYDPAGTASLRCHKCSKVVDYFAR